MHVNNFITQNYNWLLQTAHKITASEKNKEIKYDLISFVTELIIKSGKFNDLPEDEYKLLFSTFLKNQYRWKQGSEFWKETLSGSQHERYEILDVKHADDEFIDILSTCVKRCDEDKELLSFYSDLSIEKIKHVRDFEQNLPNHKKILFDLYINQQLSLSKISKKINIPKPSVYLLVKELKTQILESWEMRCS